MAQKLSMEELAKYIAPPPYDRPADVEGIVRRDGTRSYLGFEYARIDGYRPLRLDLHVPDAPGPLPVVVYIHGGGFMMGSRRGGSHDRVAGPIWNALLRDQIAVASVEYRLSGEACFPACLHDVKAAIRWLHTFAEALGLRSDAIIPWGESAGAYLSAFLGLNNDDEELNGDEGIKYASSDVRAAVAWYPPTDFATMDAQARPDAIQAHNPADSAESLLMGAALPDIPEAVQFASPVHHVTNRSAPMLLMHGLGDRLVPHQQSIELNDALIAAGRPVEMMLVEGADHGFYGIDPTPLIIKGIQFIHQNTTAA